MTKQPTTRLSVTITRSQHDMLKKLAEVSLKSQAVLIREAITLLFKTPGAK